MNLKPLVTSLLAGLLLMVSSAHADEIPVAVPANLYTPIQQDAVLLTPGKGKAGPAALLKYLQGDKAQAVIRRFGYGVAL